MATDKLSALKLKEKLQELVSKRQDHNIPKLVPSAAIQAGQKPTTEAQTEVNTKTVQQPSN